jgi:hypothetical protein
MKGTVQLCTLGTGNQEGGEDMPHIIVTADHEHDRDLNGVMLRERVNAEDFDSERFAANLIERLGWAVVDATEAERGPAHRELVNA